MSAASDSMENYPSLDFNANYLLGKRYLSPATAAGLPETPTALFQAVASAAASIEGADSGYWKDRFYSVLAGLKFLPNSPAILNSGRFGGQLAACFSLPVGPSRTDISQTLENAVLIHQRGAGTAFSLSGLPASPNGQLILDVLNKYSKALGRVLQGGIRLGCNTATLPVNHPDIFAFISAKDDPRALSNFYLSVVLDDSFMAAVHNKGTYELIDPVSCETVRRVNAGEVFDAIVESSWKNGDPGVIFEGPVQKSNPTVHLGPVQMVSGCGEQLMLPYESCILGSINMERMLQTSGSFKGIDWNRFEKTVETAVRFLDNTIDTTTFPLARIRDNTMAGRKIGLGIMGLAGMFYELGIPYDSDEAVDLAYRITLRLKELAYRTSAELAAARGAYPAWRGDEDGARRRNASLTTIAPTGTISLLAGCSPGIEPVYALCYVRHIHKARSLLEINKQFSIKAREAGFASEKLFNDLCCGIKLRRIPGIPRDVVNVFKTALDISPEWHLKMQSAIQKNIDNAVSKTVNLPSATSPEDVGRIYLDAYRYGLKGITVYRDLSRANQPLACSTQGMEMVHSWWQDMPL